jgi:lipopolysaccharide transport protein LptA
MANLLRNLSACGALALTVCTVLAAQDGDSADALSLDSKSVTLDRQTNLIEFEAPRFTRGKIHIEADKAVATSDDFAQRGELRFMGHVRMTDDAVVLEAASAVFTFDNNQLQRGELTGSPASFTGVEASNKKPVRGEANKFELDNVARTLRMMDNARINKELNNAEYEIRGCDLIYDFDAERVSSGPTDCPEGVNFRRLPRAEQQAPATEPPQ